MAINNGAGMVNGAWHSSSRAPQQSEVPLAALAAVAAAQQEVGGAPALLAEGTTFSPGWHLQGDLGRTPA